MCHAAHATNMPTMARLGLYNESMAVGGILLIQVLLRQERRQAQRWRYLWTFCCTEWMGLPA